MLRVYLLSWLLRSLKHFLESCEIQWHIIKGLSCLLRSRELPSFEPTMVVSVVFFLSVVSTVSVVFDLLAFFSFFSSCLLGHLAGQPLGCVAGPPLS